MFPEQFTQNHSSKCGPLL